MRRFVWIVAETERDTLLRGPLRDWLKVARVPAQWAPTRRGWWIGAERVADVVAMLEHDGFIVGRTGKARAKG